MKDFNGNELNIGDKVVFIEKDHNSHKLKKGIIDRFEKTIGTLCVIKSGDYEYKIRDTHTKVIKNPVTMKGM